MIYEHALIAAGETPENAAFLAQRDEYLRLTNREHPAYGVQDETIYGGGGVESRHATLRPVRNPAADGEPDAQAMAGSERLGRVSAEQSHSGSSALPASTLSPARHLSALPSRRVVGSSPDAPDFDYFRAHSYADLAGGF